MSRIITRPERITITEYSRYFAWRSSPGAGFSFDCTKEGALLEPTPTRLEHYQKCVDGTYDVIDKGIITWTRCYTESAILHCDCGHTVALDGFTTTCRCGADYNMSGQRLAPRHLWGEETGETPGAVLMGADWGD